MEEVTSDFSYPLPRFLFGVSSCTLQQFTGRLTRLIISTEKFTQKQESSIPKTLFKKERGKEKTTTRNPASQSRQHQTTAGWNKQRPDIFPVEERMVKKKGTGKIGKSWSRVSDYLGNKHMWCGVTLPWFAAGTRLFISFLSSSSYIKSEIREEEEVRKADPEKRRSSSHSIPGEKGEEETENPYYQKWKSPFPGHLTVP
ncbi:hypothetical protein CEXT_36041 [Caerostris extrusa]|uniref:Uncharacterized protein n=1 Tax=Caerostris extrusa TaxID=172846 RepID=A0AAV4MG68_CAEEX|nr:hypothetical protein CEXT_36041 [Caerostris extrusa]